MNFRNKDLREANRAPTGSDMSCNLVQCTFRHFLIIVAGFMSVGLAAAQEEVETSTPNLPIELSEIPGRAALISTSLNQSAELLKHAELLDKIEQNFT